MNIQELPTNCLTEYPNNAKIHSAAHVAGIAESIKKFGFIQPIVVDKNRQVIIGHGRLRAAKFLKLETVPIVSATELREDEIRALRILDNKLNESPWDTDLLRDELAAIEMDLTPFNVEFDLEDDAKIEQDDCDTSNVESIETKINAGDLIELGEHRIMCGDSTERTEVQTLMGKQKAELVFTDPPYGVNVKGGKNKNHIAGDLTQTAIPFSFELAVLLATGEAARFYFCGGEGNLALYGKLFERFLAQIPRHIIWVKNGFVIKPNNYHNAYEIIFFGYKSGGGGLEKWYSPRTEEHASDVWKISRDPSGSYLPPTQKPIEIPARAIRNSSPAGAVVYDPFLGSGTTLIAADQLNRICYGMEISPQYCQIIIDRYRAHCIKSSKEFVCRINGNSVL